MEPVKIPLWARLKTSPRLPLACMLAVPASLLAGYGIGLPAADWSTPKPMLLGFMLIGMLMIIAGAYLFAESVRVKG